MNIFNYLCNCGLLLYIIIKLLVSDTGMFTSKWTISKMEKGGL